MSTTISLTQHSAYFRRHCLVCDGYTNKDRVQADIFQHGEPVGGVVCQQCLALEPDVFARVCRETAERIREHAAAVEALGQLASQRPTRAAWLKANHELEHAHAGTAIQ